MMVSSCFSKRTQSVKPMTDHSTKNFWIVDLANYEPVLMTAPGRVVLESGFSLAEENLDSGERLTRLMNFIRHAKRRLDDCDPELTTLLPFGVSQRVVEQVVYLAYWKNYRVEFHMDEFDDDIVIWLRFPDKPELNCLLDQFPGGFDPYGQLQEWLDFFCSIIAEHMDIWQIHLIMDEHAYKRLTIPDESNVFIEVQGAADKSRNDDLLTLLNRGKSNGTNNT